MKEKVRLTSINYDTMRHGKKVHFIFNDGERIEGEFFEKDTGMVFINLLSRPNDYIFNILEIPDRKEFVKKIVGYEVKGDWPEVKGFDDLRKVMDALLLVTKHISPSSIIKVKRKPSTKLNFKL